MSLAKALIRPPARLRALPDGWANGLRAIWALMFALSVVTVVASTVYAVRASYWVQPTIQEFGLDFDVTTDGVLVVGTLPGHLPAVPVTAKVVAIAGQGVPADLQVAEFAEHLASAPDGQVEVVLRQPDGRTIALAQVKGPIEATPAQAQAREIRIWARLAAGLVACAALLVCSFLLAMRRQADPVAVLLAFAFVGLAAGIDPPLQFWLWTGRTIVLDVVGAVSVYCLLVALAAFPDGVFVPRLLRWTIPFGIPFAIFLSLPGMDEDLQGILGVAVLLAIPTAQIIRFRRAPAGIVRQQIKWAGLGFAVGLLLVLAAVVLAAALGDDPSTYTPLASLAVLLLFSTGMAVIALGLLIAILRFRLWEADAIITRSAAYAVVTLIVGVVWAASSDLMKLVIAQLIGRDSETGATTVGAIIAAGIFSPTQSAVLGWTRKHFSGPLDRIRDAAKRLKSWGLTEPPEEVAKRALALIDSAVHPDASAILFDSVADPEVVALREVTSPKDPRLVERFALADDDMAVGTLLIGKRSDGNRYNRQELQAIRAILPSLAEALRVSRDRLSHTAGLQRRMDEMASKLAQLEAAPKPA